MKKLDKLIKQAKLKTSKTSTITYETYDFSDCTHEECREIGRKINSELLEDLESLESYKVVKTARIDQISPREYEVIKTYCNIISEV